MRPMRRRRPLVGGRKNEVESSLPPAVQELFLERASLALKLTSLELTDVDSGLVVSSDVLGPGFVAPFKGLQKGSKASQPGVSSPAGETRTHLSHSPSSVADGHLLEKGHISDELHM